jgi:hypothetical protein
MLIDPVAHGETPDIGDEAAKAPKSIGKGDELREKLDKQLNKLGELQKVFYADGRHSLLILLQGAGCLREGRCRSHGDRGVQSGRGAGELIQGADACRARP